MDASGRITGRLVAAGRALSGISQDELANAASIPLPALQHLESAGAAWIPPEQSRALERALETFGIVVVAEADGLGAGVRLKFTRQDVRQLGRLESEGGVARPDDVP